MHLTGTLLGINGDVLHLAGDEGLQPADGDTTDAESRGKWSTRMLWSILSNAAEMYSDRKTVACRLQAVMMTSLTILSCAVSVECPDR